MKAIKNIVCILITIFSINMLGAQKLYLGVFYKEYNLDVVYDIEFLIPFPDSVYEKDKNIEWLYSNKKSSFLHLLNDESGRIYFDIRASLIASFNKKDSVDNLMSCFSFLSSLESSKIDSMKLHFNNGLEHKRFIEMILYQTDKIETVSAILTGRCFSFDDLKEGLKAIYDESKNKNCRTNFQIACSPKY